MKLQRVIENKQQEDVAAQHIMATTIIDTYPIYTIKSAKAVANLYKTLSSCLSTPSLLVNVFFPLHKKASLKPSSSFRILPPL